MVSIRSGWISDKAVQGRSFRFLLPLMVVVVLAACTITSDTEKRPTGERSVKTDAGSIARGKNLFQSQCVLCHATNSTETVVGPGMKGILKKAVLPVSKRPATPENIAGQMKQPYRDMPSFPHLSDDEIDDIISYLNTL